MQMNLKLSAVAHTGNFSSWGYWSDTVKDFQAVSLQSWLVCFKRQERMEDENFKK